MGRKRMIAILSGLVVCDLCGDTLLFRDEDSSFYHFPNQSRCKNVGLTLPQDTLNEKLWRDLSERLVLTQEQKEAIVTLAMTMAKGTSIQLDPEDAQIRLGAVVQMMRDYVSVDPAQVNRALHDMIKEIRVNAAGDMRYVARPWVASLFRDLA